MKLSILRNILTTHTDHPEVFNKLLQFISKYKNKAEDLSPGQVFELIENTELFKYHEESYSPTSIRSELVIHLQNSVASEMYDAKASGSDSSLHRLKLEELIATLRCMHEVNILNKENFIELMGKREKIQYLGLGLIHLCNAKLCTPQNRNQIIILYRQVDTDVSHQFNCALSEIIRYHDHDNLLEKQKLFDLLIKYPGDAYNLRWGIKTLADAKILNAKNLELLLKHLKEAWSVARGLASLTESKLDTIDNLKTILSNPRDADGIAMSLNVLYKAGLLNEKNRAYFEKTSNFCFILPYKLKALSENNIINDKTVKLLFNCNEEKLYSISPWIIKLAHEKLFNESNFSNLFKYSDILGNKKLRETCHLLLNPRNNCYEQFQHLLIDLTQERLDTIFKFCQEIEDKEITIEDCVNKIIHYVAELNEEQNGWDSRLESNDQDDLKYLFTPEGLEALRHKKITIKQFLQLGKSIDSSLRYPLISFNKYTYIALTQNLLNMSEILDFPYQYQMALRRLYTPYGLAALEKNYIRLENIKTLSKIIPYSEMIDCILEKYILSKQALELFDYNLVSMDGWIKAFNSGLGSGVIYQKTAIEKYKSIQSAQHLTCFKADNLILEYLDCDVDCKNYSYSSYCTGNTLFEKRLSEQVLDIKLFNKISHSHA